MQILIVYDSVFGNTEKIAAAIASALTTSLGDSVAVELFQAGQVQPPLLVGRDLLVVGSPTRGFHRCSAQTAWL